MGSHDGDAIFCALDLLKESNSRGGRHIFVLTDGQSSSRVQVTRALYQAQQSQVGVTALCVGGDVPTFYQYNQWACAGTPTLLPTAIRNIFESSGASGGTPPLKGIES